MATKNAVETVETVEAVDAALANGAVEQEAKLEKQASVNNLLRQASGQAQFGDGGTPVPEQRPLPKDVMDQSPLVQDARLALARAEEHVAELEQEQRNIANAQLDASEMAGNPTKFRELRTRWGEIDGEIYLAKVQAIHASTALAQAQITALEEGLPEIDEKLRELNAQITALQAQAAPLANDGYRRQQLIKGLRDRKPANDRKLGNLEYEWAAQLRAQLPTHMRDAIKR